MAFIKINDKLKKRGKQEVRFIPKFSEGTRIKVLTDSCPHCMKLRDNTIEAMRRLGMDSNEMEIITDLTAIVKAGIIATPALIVDGMLVSCGKALTVDEIIPLVFNESKAK